MGFIKSPIYEIKLIFDEFSASELLIGMTWRSEIFTVNRKPRVVSPLKISIIYIVPLDHGTSLKNEFLIKIGVLKIDFFLKYGLPGELALRA